VSRASCVVAVLCLAAAAPVQSADLGPELWDRPRSAQAILAHPQLREAVAQLQAKPAARLRLAHGTRAETQAQAEELRAWLIALAVEPSRLMLRADAAVAGVRLEWVD